MITNGFTRLWPRRKRDAHYTRLCTNMDTEKPFIELRGEFYQSFLARMHSALAPRTYFEIGTLNGDTLKLASCASISVDQSFMVTCNVIGKKPVCHFFQLGSDDFFKQNDPKRILGKPIDLAFLDGMHLFEFLLRDFCNTERYCLRSSVIVLHDCIPGDEYIAVRDPTDPLRQQSAHPGYWTGDVWKILSALQNWRPDLKIVVVDAPPTGLVLITNLDPANVVLEQNYQAILDTYLNLHLGSYGIERLHREAKIISTATFATAANFASLARFNDEYDLIETASASVGKPLEVLGPGNETMPPVGERRALPSSFTFESPPQLAKSSTRDSHIRVTIEGAGELEMRMAPAPVFHDDPDGTGLFTISQDNAVPHTPPFTIDGAGLWLAGYRTFMSRSRLFFNDEWLVNQSEVERFLERITQASHFENEETGLVASGIVGMFNLKRRDRRVTRLDGDVLSLCSHEPSNYGSFLFRVLPKLAGRMGLLEHRRVLTPLHTNSMRDLLEMTEVSRDKIIPHDTRTIYEFERVTIPSVRNPHALLDAESLAFYAALRDRYGSRKRSKKIFVTRLGWTESYAAKHRVMLNEGQVADRLVSEGFTVIRPHAMTAREQIEAFSSADLILGAAGSAMFNAVFSHPGTKVIDIESEPHWWFTHQNLFGSCGLNYGVFEAKALDNNWTKHHKPFKVNIDALMARIALLG